MSHHLVGSAEAAAILGISRQELAKLVTEAADFPAPEVILKAGRIWSRTAIHTWAVNHPNGREGGRAVIPPAVGGWSSQLRTIMRLAGGEAAARKHHWLGLEHVELALVHPDCPGAAPQIPAICSQVA